MIIKLADDYNHKQAKNKVDHSLSKEKQIETGG